ncbi:MAG: hypothetical protein V1697_00930 [Candidatus Levyibacteriota bacterium]
MPTLSQVSFETRSIAKWGGIIVGVFLLLFILFKAGVFIKETLYPTPPPPPTVGYDVLNPIIFPEQKEERSFTYTLDTVTGTFPNFPDRAKVFTIAKAEPDLLALRKAEEKMNRADFSEKPVLIGQNVYKWTTNKPFPKAISYNILTLDFNLTSSFLNNPDSVSGKGFPLETQAIIDTANGFFSNLNSFPDDIDIDKTVVDLFTIKNYVLLPATSISNAQAARVYFFQNEIDEKPIFYSNPKASPINTLITGGNNRPEVAEANYYYQKITEKNETYPIKTAEQAFNDLKEGNAYIAASPQEENDVLIKNLYLGYYVGDEKQTYLLPIIILEGDNGFFAYVSAVTDVWINK